MLPNSPNPLELAIVSVILLDAAVDAFAVRRPSSTNVSKSYLRILDMTCAVYGLSSGWKVPLPPKCFAYSAYALNCSRSFSRSRSTEVLILKESTI